MVGLRHQGVWVDAQAKEIEAKWYISDVDPLTVQVATVEVTTVGGYALVARGTTKPENNDKNNKYSCVCCIRMED